jgi:hypothetical protein
VALALVADRGVLSGTLHGGRLLPAPGGAADLWSAYLAGWHPVGVGSTAPAPPWLAVLAALSSALFGKPWLAVAVIMLGAVPLAGWTAYAAGSGLTGSRWLRAWSAVAYALLPVGLGAVAGGRLDIVVVLILLPVTARAVVAAIAPSPSSRARPVAAGLLLAVSAAFAPLVWAVVALAALAAVAVAMRPAGRAAGRLLLVLAAAFLVLLPWSWHVVAHPSLALAGSGLADTFRLARPQRAADLVLLHPAGPAQPPVWLAAGYLLGALAGLSRGARSRSARAAFAAFVACSVAALVISRLDVPGPPADARYWTGVPLAVAGLCLLCCCLVAGDGARPVLARHSFGWRQVAATVITVAVAVATAGSAVVWVQRGVARPLTGKSAQLLPAFATATVALPTASRALVLRPDGDGVGYALVRSASGPTLGDADLPLEMTGSSNKAAKRLDDAVARLVGGDPDAATLLTELGIGQIADRAGDDRHLTALGRVDGLTAVPASGIVVRRVSTRGGELVMLPADAAGRVRAGGALPSSARPVPLAARAGHARTRLPEGAAGRLLVLAEPADSHWRATLDGRSLPRATAYGWAQAWSLPAGGGRLSVSRASDGRGALLHGELALLAVIALAARPRPAARST